jgi:hypothetical protein
MWAELRHNLDNLHGEIRAIEGLAVSRHNGLPSPWQQSTAREPARSGT